MASFSSLLSSIGGNAAKSSPAPTMSTPRPTTEAPSAAKPQALSTDSARPLANNASAGIKRKADDQTSTVPAKTVRTEAQAPAKPPGTGSREPSASKPAPPVTATSANPPSHGTTRPQTSAQPAIASSKRHLPLQKPAASPTAIATGDDAPKPKRGFAAILEKAKATAALQKPVGTITHKPVEKLSKRERHRVQEENKSRGVSRGVRPGIYDRSRSGTPIDGKATLHRRPGEMGYKGTMKGAPAEKKVAPQVTYRGTMGKAGPEGSNARQQSKKAVGQERYGGYASWSDLSDAEDGEAGYDSYESDDMEAGFDDVAVEETMALRAARKEDQEALQEEERHRKEKEDRKKRLQALSKTAAAKKQ